MITLTTKLSFALLMSMLGTTGCATTPTKSETTPTKKIEEKESYGIEIVDASFIQEGDQWFVTGQLKARRPLPPSQRRVQVDAVDAKGSVVYSRAAVARSFAVTPHVARNAARPAMPTYATFKIAIPDPSTFDHADIRIAKDGATAK